MLDAHAAWRWMVEQSAVDTSRIVLYGRSLGGAVTIQLARALCEEADKGLPGARLPAGIIVANTFTSIADTVSSVYPFLRPLMPVVRKRLLRLQWRSVEHIRFVRLPIMMIVGLQDEIVPAAHSMAVGSDQGPCCHPCSLPFRKD